MGIDILLQKKHLYRKGIRLHHNPKLLDVFVGLYHSHKFAPKSFSPQLASSQLMVNC